MKNLFDLKESEEMVNRINDLNQNSVANWGVMTVDQMLAHCNVIYEMVYDDIHAKPGVFMKFILKLLVKKGVVNDVPYSRNTRTAPQFLVTTSKDFVVEKSRLIAYIRKTAALGSSHFDGKDYHSFGKLNKVEWNNMFSKHLDHHLTQFGV